MPQSLASVHVHFVFSTKHREPRLSEDLRPRLHAYIGGTLRSKSCSLVSAGGTEDHIHLLVSMCRTISLAESVQAIKSNSSRWIHEEFPTQREFHWQDGYGAFAVSFSNLGIVKQYLASQEEHHRQRSY